MAVVGKIMDGETIVEQTYPCLKKHFNKGYVVLFSGKSMGVVVVSTDSKPVGYYSNVWPGAESKYWTDVDSVLLTTK